MTKNHENHDFSRFLPRVLCAVGRLRAAATAKIKVDFGNRPSDKCVLCPCLSNGWSYASVAYWEGSKMVSRKRVLFIKSFDFVTKRVFFKGVYYNHTQSIL